MDNPKLLSLFNNSIEFTHHLHVRTVVIVWDYQVVVVTIILSSMLFFMAFMMRSIVTVFTLAKYPAGLPTLITLAILLHTVSFPAFTPFSHILYLKPKTKHHRFLLQVLFLLLLNIETMRISSQRFNYRLFMPCHIFRMIPTVVTVTVLIAKYLLLETFTIKFQAF